MSSNPARALPFIQQTQLLPQGTPAFEAKRAALLKALTDKFPLEFYLPQELIDNPPTDVSGIPSSCGILTPEEVEITENYDATDLAEAVATHKYTAVAVATAFSKRAAIAHQLTACLTQFLMTEALDQAAQLDAYLAEYGKTVGPLHGVPVSIKDHMPIAGTYSSQGSFGSIVFDKADCHMVSILRAAGAVFFCKTNQPQTIMHLESDSHWGRVVNPFNIHLSAGGSTGGEAALIALKGSPLGVGTDIGGSVRGPAAFCGIYGFKATSYTLPQRGFLATPFAAELNVLCSTGPMCRTLRDMDLFMHTIQAAKPFLLDPALVPLPWTGLQTPRPAHKLRVGIVHHDGFIQPQPPVACALTWAHTLLSAPQHAALIEVTPFHPPGAAAAWSLIRRLYWPDGGRGLADAIAATGEPLHALSAWIWKDAAAAGMRTADEVSRMRRERDDFRAAFAAGWTAQGVDVVLAPAFVGPACAHDTALYWTYTSLYNLVDYPGVVFPTGLKVEDGERYAEDYVPLGEECEHVKQLWEESNFEGAPVNLQLVARKHHDNDLFGALAVLKDILDLP